MSKESWKETRSTMWGMFLYRFGMVRLKDYKELAEKHYRMTGQFTDLRRQADELMAAMNKGDACCQLHATPAQKMTQMIVCPDCGDKRCNKAEICRLDCNDPSGTNKGKDDAFH